MILRKRVFSLGIFTLITFSLFGCRPNTGEPPAGAALAAATQAALVATQTEQLVSPAGQAAIGTAPAAADQGAKAGHWEGQALFGADRLAISFDMAAPGQLNNLQVDYTPLGMDRCAFSVNHIEVDEAGGFSQELKTADLTQAIGLDGLMSGSFKDAQTLDGKITIKMCGRSVYFNAADLPWTVKWASAKMAAAEPPEPTATATMPALDASPTAAATATPALPTAPPQPFAIQDPAFTSTDERDCATDAVITGVDGKSLTASGTIAFRNNGFVFWCYGARHTWKGNLTYGGYTFASNDSNPLAFVIDRTHGYLYQSGAGTVTFPNGTQVNLPQSSAAGGTVLQATVDPASGPGSTPMTPVGKRYLGDLKPDTYTLGYGRFSVGEFMFSSEDPADNIQAGDPIMLNSVDDPHAIFAHAPAKIVYTLGGKYNSFQANIGLIESINCGDGVIFRVLVDGKEVLTYGPLLPLDNPMHVVAELANGNEMTLVTDVGPNGNKACDWAIWGDAFVR